MTTVSNRLEAAFKERIKKHYVAELLNISRPTLNTKLKDNDFTENEIKVLVENNVIDSQSANTAA